MHSSRMRTGRSLTLCWRLLPGGRGVYSRGGVCSGMGGVCSRGEGVLCLLLGGCLLWGVSAPGGVSTPGGCLLWGVSALGGVCSWGVSAPGGVCSGRCLLLGGCLLGGCLLPGGYPSMQWGRHPPSPLWTELQTPVKTLPWPNFVAAANKFSK